MRLPQRRRGPRERQRRVGNECEIVASWGAALRFGTAESQDESRCGAIHKQRPYRRGTERDGVMEIQEHSQEWLYHDYTVRAVFAAVLGMGLARTRRTLRWLASITSKR